VFLPPVVFDLRQSPPTAVLLSPVVIAVPASYPNKVLFSDEPDVKLSPALIPATVFL
jgi:hypothetical protein